MPRVSKGSIVRLEEQLRGSSRVRITPEISPDIVPEQGPSATGSAALWAETPWIPGLQVWRLKD